MDLSSCPSRAELSEYATGLLSPDRVEALERHLHQCDKCADLAEKHGDADIRFTMLLQESARLASPLVLEEVEFRHKLERVAGHRFISMSTGFRQTDPTKTIIGDSLVDVTGPPSATSAELPLPTGAKLGQYDLLEEVGRGGMGVVYKARHRKLNRLVALKLLPPSLTNDAGMLERFEHEMRAIGSLDHPNIVRAMDADVVDGIHLLVMEFVDGETLSGLLRRRGVLPVDEACRLICQAAAGLQHIHDAGMVHRDIKPGNLMLSTNGTLRILDMGLALLTEAQLCVPDEAGTGLVMGTLNYMSPEQFENTHAVDIRADIYSLGATFYALLTGQTPYAGRGEGSALQKLRIMATEDPTPIETLRPDLPPAIVALVGQMMHRDRTHRMATPQELLEQLELIAPAKSMTASALSANQRPPIQWLRPLLIVSSVLAILTIGIVIHSGLRSGRSTSGSELRQHRLEVGLLSSRGDQSEKRALTDAGSTGLAAMNSSPDIHVPSAEPGARVIPWESSNIAAEMVRQAKETGNFSNLLKEFGQTRDPSLKTRLIHTFAQQNVSATTLISLLEQPHPDEVRAALWLGLGVSVDLTSAAGRDLIGVWSSLKERLLTDYAENKSPAVHSAVQWLVRHWRKSESTTEFQNLIDELDEDFRELREELQLRPMPMDAGWHENIFGDTMIIVPGGVEFTIGSPADEAGRADDDSLYSELQQHAALPVAIAVCSTEVTQEQYLEVLRAALPRPKHVQLQHPVSGLSWHNAAWFCNRRSELEGLPSDEYCYEQISSQPAPMGRYRLKENYHQRRGYRMLDEAEWEYCCRAGSETARPFGHADDLAGNYIVMAESGHDAPLEVGMSMPNAHGFFDMLGNTAEWVNEPAEGRKRPARRARGGSTLTGYARLRSANRLVIEEDYPHPNVGLRVCRSLRPDRDTDYTEELMVEVLNGRKDAGQSLNTSPSSAWRPLKRGETVCLGTGDRNRIPERRFRIVNRSDQIMTLGEPTRSGITRVCNNPAMSLAPGDNSEWIVGGSGAIFGVNAGFLRIPVTSESGGEDYVSISITAALHDERLHVLEGGMSGDPGTYRSFSFGEVRQHSSVTHRFSIHNCGDRPLRIVNIEVPDHFHLRHDWLPTAEGGEFSWFTIKVDTAELGEFSGQIKVKTSDRKEPEFRFPVSATVVQGLPAGIPGIFRDGIWLFDENRDGIEHPVYEFGQKGDVPLTGDWNGDGISDLCICRSTPDSKLWTWHVKFLGENPPAPIEKALIFGSTTGTPMLVAEKRAIGFIPAVVVPDADHRLVWQFDANRDGQLDPDRTVPFGSVPDVPVAADIDGDGTAEIGYVRRFQNHLLNSEWHFRDPHLPDDKILRFAVGIDTPVVGDWDGDGKQEAGAFRNHPAHTVEWLLNLDADALSEQEHEFGRLGDIPVVLETRDLRARTSATPE
ncbi:MAG: protein kinase [Planctomycetaceae bacterium]|nr:protein kinase [Planctomycetaceae bacterium]